jgi:hypothetical protein
MQTQNNENEGAMKKTEMHVIQSAHQWRELDKQWIAAPAEQKTDISRRLGDAKRKLRMSCDLDAANNETKANP